MISASPLLGKLVRTEFFQIFISLVFWWSAGLSLINNTTYDYQHDLGAHIDYSKWLTKTGKLPHPESGGEKFHPPGFYLFCQVFLPGGNTQKEHVKRVRIGNFLLFGSIFVIALVKILRSISKFKGYDPKYIPLISLWSLSTPALITTFASYNNDAMSAGLVSLAILGVIHILEGEPKPKIGALLRAYWPWFLLITTSSALSMHTKYSAGVGLLTLLFVIVYLSIKESINKKTGMIIAMAIIIGGLSIGPYAYFHNYRLTDKLLPSGKPDNDPRWMEYANLERYGGYWKFITTPPINDLKKWSTPYIYDSSNEADDLFWTKGDLTSSLIVTSLYGEWDHTSRTGQLGKALAWIILFNFVIVAALSLNLKNRIILEALLCSLTIWLLFAFMLYQLPYANAANARYIPWMWYPISTLIMIGLNIHNQKYIKSLLIISLYIGIAGKTLFTYSL